MIDRDQEQPETLDDLTPLERKIIEQFLLDYPGTSPEEAIKDFRDQGL
jgi:predicted RNA-binding protein Jag